MKKIILSLFSICSFWSANAQQSALEITPDQRCGTTQKMEAIKAQDPQQFYLNQAEQEAVLQDWIDNHYEEWKAQRAVVTIPTVFHIWESTSTVPDSRVQEQLDRLNLDFRHQNADAGNAPQVFQDVAADCEIEFCLASIDEQGNATTGIVRHTAGGSPGQSNADMWDGTSYLNIYVYGISGGTLGFTVLPSSNPNYPVHIGTQYFGSTGAQAPYNMGRTASHEIGHWFNLQHIWGDANCGDDFVADTPTQQTSNGGCPQHPSATCSNNGDMFVNYMDYTNDNCMNMFSEGQKARMIAAINAYRPGILTSNGCNGQTGGGTGGGTGQTITCDTLNWPLAGTPTIYGVDTGYVTGNNKYSDKSKANFYASTGNKQIVGMGVAFQVAKASVSNPNIEFTIWGDNGGTPSTEMGTKSVAVAEIATNITNNLVTFKSFDNQVPINSNFYAGVKLNEGLNDTIAILSNTAGDTNPGIAWEQLSNSQWTAMDGSWGDFKVALAIYPIVCNYPVGINKVVAVDEIKIYPNPSTGIFNLQVNDDRATIQVYNVTGNLINHVVSTNSNNSIINLSNHTNGLYFVKIQTANGITTQKINLMK